MQKLIISVFSLGFFLLIAGCQTTSLNPMGTAFNSYPTGTTLTQSVQDALYRSGDPVLAQVHVETNINTVILSGYVQKIRQSDM
ncbi:MAG: BON domain-containing protein, partial [Legionella sp.]